MGQKIHPTGFRLSVSRNWASRWYASNRDFAGMLAEDIKVREYLKAKLKNAAVSRVLIERPAKNARITIFSARPGVVIGKKGEDIEKLKKDLAAQLGVPVAVNIEEVRKPEVDAQLIADSITQQLEKRIMFRRAMKRAMQNAMRLGAQGIKIMSAGRLNGIEIARTEWYREGRVPLHTLRADIDYGTSEAKTTYGIIGVKCVIAPSFARIFYRNAINIGFPILECAEAAEGIQAGDTVSVDFGTGVITDETTGKTYQAAPLPEFVQGIVDNGGLLKSLKARGVAK